MKKAIIFTILAIWFTAFTLSDTIYDITLRDIDGGQVALSNYQGQKILFIVLPVAAGDTAQMNELARFQEKYGSRINIVGILSMESGYTAAHREKIKKLYLKHRGMNMLITESMYVKKSAGIQQSALCQWLTQKEKNIHFNEDVKGVYHKFIIDESGKLYAVLGPDISLLNPVMDKIMNKQ